MTEELLRKIKDESDKEISKLNKCDAYTNANSEKIESDVIMKIYKKYSSQIEEADTNNIYVYSSTYMMSDFTPKQIEYGNPLEIEVEIDDPRATHRYYWNLEGIYSISVNIEDCEEFEKTHTVLYVDNFYELQKEFVITAIKESQERAVNKVLKKQMKS